MEYRRRLNELNVLVKESRQTIFRRAHKDIAVLVMFPYAEFLYHNTHGQFSPKGSQQSGNRDIPY